MSLFDQQPMGPIPARRPILLPPDPELEAAVPDPATAEVQLVGPVPRELAGAAPAGRPRAAPGHRLRIAVALLLVAPSLVSIIPVWLSLFAPDALLGNVPGFVVIGLVVPGALAVAMVVSQLRRRTLPAVVWLVGSIIVLAAGLTHAAVDFYEHLAHPEWSAPASVTFVVAVPYLIVSGLLFFLFRRSLRQPADG